MGAREGMPAVVGECVQLLLPYHPVVTTEVDRRSDPAVKSASDRRKKPEGMGTIGHQRVRFAFNGGIELLALLRRAQEVLKHKFPAGDLDRIFMEALEALLDKKDPDRRLLRKERHRVPAAPPKVKITESNPHLQPRYIPLAVRDAVWRRDGGQCVFVGPDGLRCAERGGLEFDHIIPHALGGPSKDPANIRLLCKAHNLRAARRVFGEKALGFRLRPDPF